MASLIGRVQDLVIEDGEVQCETETDRMSWGKVGCGNFGGRFVGLQGLIGRDLTLVTKCKLSKVTMIVALPMSERQSYAGMHGQASI